VACAPGTFAAGINETSTLGAVQQFGSAGTDALSDVVVDAEGVPHAVGYVGAALPDQTGFGGQDAFLMRLAL
jgi:hypothetical protein